MIAMSYLAYWLGEVIMGTSAVIVIVVFGLYMNYYRSSMSPEVHHFLHQFYGMVAEVRASLPPF